MQATWVEMLENKKFWYAILSAIAAVVSLFGFNLSVPVTLAIVSPFMIAIGAQGWADTGPAALLAKQVKLLAKAHALPDGHAMKAPLLKLVAGAIVFTFTFAGCSASGAQIEHNGFACAGKQASASLLEQVAVDLFTKNFADLEQLGVSNGITFVNCLVTTTVATHATPPELGSNAKAPAPSPIVVNGNEWLSTHGGAP